MVRWVAISPAASQRGDHQHQTNYTTTPTMSTDWKALCEELLIDYEQHLYRSVLADRARAALAAEPDGPAVQSREPASVAGEPSDDELLELSQFHCVSITLNNGSAVSPFVEGTDIRSEVLSFARAVMSLSDRLTAPPADGDVAELALKELEQTVVLLMPVTGHKKIKRFDTIRAALKRLQGLKNKADLSPAPVPAEGEVAELVAWLRANALTVQKASGNPANGAKQRMNRAADLLSQRHPTPVPVAERLPEPGDCDEEGFCWWFSPADPSAGTFGVAACWVLRKHEPEDDFRTHWLPFTALPMPAGEVQP